MPWSPTDSKRHIKGLTKSGRKKWSKIANGVLVSCRESGGEDCEGKAIRIANSRFQVAAEKMGRFNPVFDSKISRNIISMFGGREKFLKSLARELRFTFQKRTRPDPQDGHTHIATLDNDGNGVTDSAGDPNHTHQVQKFIVQPAMLDPDGDDDVDYVSWHPGNLALNSSDMDYAPSGVQVLPEDTGETGNEIEKRDDVDEGEENIPEDADNLDDIKISPEDDIELRADEDQDERGVKIDEEMGEKVGTIEEMEIFRSGTHNGEEFGGGHLREIAENFRALKGEVRPKLKITHRENQEDMAGLMSYGDVEDVYCKLDEIGNERLYARIVNIPNDVIEMIKDRRFPERSIELYPEFKLGTNENSPTYRNVLKAVALLGHEMPAVTGMAPVALTADYGFRSVCFNEKCECSEMDEILFMIEQGKRSFQLSEEILSESQSILDKSKGGD